MRSLARLRLALAAALAGAAGLTGCATRRPTPAAPAPATGVAWTLRFAAPAADPEVTVTTPCLGGRAPKLRVGNRLGHLDHLDAFVTGITATADGTPVNVHRKGGTVTVDAGRCRVLRVRYHLALPRAPFPVAEGDSERPARAGELPFSGRAGLFLLGRLTLLSPDVAPVGPVRLTLAVPRGWHAYAPLARTQDGAFVAPDVGAVLHAFYAATPRAAQVVRAGGSTARILHLVEGDPGADAHLEGELGRLVAVEAGLFDAGDAWHGLLIVKDDQPPKGIGAAVAGQAVILDVPLKRDPGLDDFATRIAALELAHTWRCAARPTPGPGPLQWDFQGVARYLSWLAWDRVQGRGDRAPSGLTSALDEATRASAQAHEPSLLAAGARFATDPAARTLAGAGGALLAFHLDRRLRAEGLSLVGLLRRLRNRWCPRHPTFGLADVLAVARAYGGTKVAGDLKAQLHAPGFPNPKTVLAGTDCRAKHTGTRWQLSCHFTGPAPSKETHHDRPPDPP